MTKPYTYSAPQHDWKCGYPDITNTNNNYDDENINDVLEQIKEIRLEKYR